MVFKDILIILFIVYSAVSIKDWKKIRYTLQDFTNWYRRKNVNYPILAPVLQIILT